MENNEPELTKEEFDEFKFKYQKVISRLGIKDRRIRGLTGMYFIASKQPAIKVYFNYSILDLVQIFVIYLKIRGFTSFTKWVHQEIKRKSKELIMSNDPEYLLAKNIYLDLKHILYKKIQSKGIKV